jgi:hypothetical protein
MRKGNRRGNQWSTTKQTSWACWKLRDVCYPDCNWSEVVDSFPFIGFAYYRTWPWITRQVYCNRHELLTLTKQRGSPPFHWRSVLFMSICVLSVFVGCCSVLCFQCVSFGLGCRSLIAPSIFFSHFGLMKLKRKHHSLTRLGCCYWGRESWQFESWSHIIVEFCLQFPPTFNFKVNV